MLALQLRGAGRLEPVDALAIAEGLERYLTGEAELDVALGVRPAPGQRRPATESKQATRDHLLRESAARFYPGQPARVLAEALAAYASTAWSRKDRELAECPARYTGTARELFWQILKLRDHAPKERALRGILGNELPVFIAEAPAHDLAQERR